MKEILEGAWRYQEQSYKEGMEEANPTLPKKRKAI